MPPLSRFDERIGKVFLPEADIIDTGQDFTPNPEGPELPPGIPGLPGELERPPLQWPPLKWPPDLIWPKLCFTTLKPGCYTIGFTPTGTSIFGTRYRGTLRVEDARPARCGSPATSTRTGCSTTSSSMAARDGLERSDRSRCGRCGMATEARPRRGGTIPIYRRDKYHSYLKGTSAQLFRIVPKWSPSARSRSSFDEFVYNHPATGFSGSFNPTPTRSLRFVLRHTSTPDLYSGEAYDGSDAARHRVDPMDLGFLPARRICS